MNSNVRIADFTKRQVGVREQLYLQEPTVDRGNWNFLAEIVIWFGLTVVTGCFLIAGYLAYLMVSWP